MICDYPIPANDDSIRTIQLLVTEISHLIVSTHDAKSKNDISNKEIEEVLKNSLNAEMFVKRYSDVSKGPKLWQNIKTDKTSIYNWDEGSTYVKKPPFFENLVICAYF